MGVDEAVGGEGEDEVPAPTWARFLLAVAPFLIAALVLLGLRLLDG